MKTINIVLLSLAGILAAHFTLAQDVPAGPIWNQADANTKCPGVCQKDNMSWNGQWTTTVPGQMSVCGCASCASKDVNAGPIWNQANANAQCPTVCQNDQLAWNGQWTTTVPGQMSVCGCKPTNCK